MTMSESHYARRDVLGAFPNILQHLLLNSVDAQLQQEAQAIAIDPCILELTHLVQETQDFTVNEASWQDRMQSVEEYKTQLTGYI